MKEVKLTLSGEGQVWWIDSILKPNEYEEGDYFCDLEDRGVLDMDSLNEISVILSDLKIEVDDRLIVKKGKYINTKNYLTDILKPPCYVNGPTYTHIDEMFIIQLEDDEEFDPMKLQLVKTDYEVEFIPYGIIISYIVYDGKEIGPVDPYQCDSSFDGEDNFTMEDFFGR